MLGKKVLLQVTVMSLTKITIKIIHPSEETIKYANQMYENDGWKATQFSLSRELCKDGGGVDTLRPKPEVKIRNSLRKTMVAFLLSFNFELMFEEHATLDSGGAEHSMTFKPPEDIKPPLQHEVTFPKIIQQLGAVFKNPGQILRFLAEEGGFLGGSEALQAFVSGATDENSDMDFYVDGASVADMMLVLAKSGVSWLQSAADQVDKALEAKYCPISTQLLRYISLIEKKDENCIPESDLYKFYMVASSRDLIHKHAELIAEKYVAADGTTHYVIEPTYLQVAQRTRSIDGDGATSTTGHWSSFISETNHAYGVGMLVVSGTVARENGNNKRVQVISNRYSGNKSSVFEILMRFWGSHIQCFVGGWCAAHTHYQAAKRRKMYTWRLKAQNPESVGKALKKYRQRGFEDAQGNHPHWRSLFDDQSYFIDFSHEVLEVRANPNWWLDAKYFAKLYNMSVSEIIKREREAQASDNDELWLTNRRANLVSIRWQNVSGRTHYPKSTLFSEGLFRWAW